MKKTLILASLFLVIFSSACFEDQKTQTATPSEEPTPSVANEARTESDPSLENGAQPLVEEECGEANEPGTESDLNLKNDVVPSNEESLNEDNEAQSKETSETENMNTEEVKTFKHGEVVSNEDFDKVKLEAGQAIAECTTYSLGGMWPNTDMRFFTKDGLEIGQAFEIFNKKEGATYECTVKRVAE